MGKVKKIIFVCTGNSCRSPMAEGLLKKMLEGKNKVEVSSAGTAAFFGTAATKEAVEVMKEEGIDISQHKSHQLSLKDIDESDIIVVMGKQHLRDVLSLVPEAKGKTFLLKNFDDDEKSIDRDLADPIGGSKDVYRQCLEEIKRTMPNIVLEVLKDTRKSSVAIGADHGGFELKEKIREYLKKKGYQCVDFGCFDKNSVDYPDFGKSVAQAVAQKKYEKGILICTTGIGMSIVANKVNGIRAALCQDEFSAEMSRRHNDTNVLVMGAKMVEPGKVFKIIEVWFKTEFEGGRHQRRVDKIIKTEEEEGEKR